MLSAANAADSLMLTRLSQDALSAVSLANQTSFVYNMVILAVTSGLGIFASQYWGKGDRDSVEKIFAYVFRIAAVLCILSGLAALIIPRFLMRIFTNDELLVEEGVIYLQFVSPMYFITGISQIFLCILKNSGKTLYGTAVSSLGVIINVLFNALLIYGIGFFPRLEIRGAAIATDISKFCELILYIIMFCRKDSIKLRLKYVLGGKLDFKAEYWKVSLPFLLNQLIWGAGFTMYSVILGHMGSDAVAANSMANVVRNLVTCFSSGIASGTGIMLGNEMGRGNLSLAKHYGKKLYRIALYTGIIMALVIMALSPLVLEINAKTFSDTSLYYLKWMLLVAAVTLIGKSCNMCTNNGIFPSGGDTKFSMYMDLVSMWVICIPLGLLSAFVFHAPVLVVFVLINLDEIVKLPLIFIHFRKYGWIKNLTR